jgi:predicted enzyme related to lactoylglutathione lyase
MSLCHFDIPAENCEAAKQFYGGVFGWTFEEDEGASECWSISFESGEQSGPVTGGIVPRSAPTQPMGCHFLVSSVDESSAKIQELGGAVFVPRTAVPGRGFYACCLDPEGNYFVIWENDEKAELQGQPLPGRQVNITELFG